VRILQNVFKYLNDRHEQRINKLEELLEQRQKQLNDHESGHRKLSSEEHARVLRQTNNFERKLNQLKNIEPDELADLMQHEAESIYKLNSVDYLDFEIKN
jgi:succinate dehydrogenase flavin-adding protein (antitoxin of CptAB toxin-antitoxin module)